MDVILQPWTLALPDFDADGHLDLAVLIDRGDGYVLAAYGDGTGAFVPATEFAVQSGPTEFAVADLDLDGATDAFGTEVNGDVLVRENLGDGFFDNAASLPLSGASDSAVAADLGGDGVPDLVVGATTSGEPSLLVWMGAIDFDYAPPTTIQLPFTPRHAIAVGIGGGAAVDLVAVGDDSGAATLWAMLDWDTGVPCGISIPLLESFPSRLAAADIDADGDQDFAVAMGPRLAYLLRQ
jgi:hypothetical protein